MAPVGIVVVVLAVVVAAIVVAAEDDEGLGPSLEPLRFGRPGIEICGSLSLDNAALSLPARNGERPGESTGSRMISLADAFLLPPPRSTASNATTAITPTPSNAKALRFFFCGDEGGEGPPGGGPPGGPGGRPDGGPPTPIAGTGG